MIVIFLYLLSALGVPDLPLDKPSKRKGLPHTVTVLDAPDGGKVYVVGTAHFSQESQEDVSRVMCIIILCFGLAKRSHIMCISDRNATTIT